MGKIFVILFVASAMFFLGSQRAIAQNIAKEEPAVTQDAEPVNVGNKICPVSGEKIEEKLKATYEYKGKIYNFCCTSCIEEFKKDPEKYIKKVEQELNAKEQEQTEKTQGMQILQGDEGSPVGMSDAGMPEEHSHHSH